MGRGEHGWMSTNAPRRVGVAGAVDLPVPSFRFRSWRDHFHHMVGVILLDIAFTANIGFT